MIPAMKGLSVRAPWAYMIAAGLKTMETRTWQTAYRGNLVITIPKGQPVPFAGHAICLVRLVDCRPMRNWDSGPACVAPYPKAKVWILDNLRRIKPVPITGHQGVFPVNPERIEVLEPF